MQFNTTHTDEPIAHYNLAKLNEILSGNAKDNDADTIDGSEIAYLRTLNGYPRPLANAYHTYGLAELNRKRFYMDRKLKSIDAPAVMQQMLQAPVSKGVHVERPLFEQQMAQQSLKRAIDPIGGANLLKRAVDRLGGGHLLKRR